MRRFFYWFKWVAFAVFLIDWAVLGIEFLNGNFGSDISVVAAYVGTICFGAVFLRSFILALTSKCPYCKRTLPLELTRLTYCPHCGKKLDS